MRERGGPTRQGNIKEKEGEEEEWEMRRKGGEEGDERGKGGGR